MTRVIAHRTLPRNARENSLDGIGRAAAFGADVVEVDARRSRDGTAVLLHDPLLLRVQHVPVPVRWCRDSWLARLGVPTLAEALDAASALGLQVAIDTKDPGAAAAVLAAVHATGTADRVLPWSQHLPVVRAFAAGLPGAEVALLRDSFDDAGHTKLLDDAIACGARAVSAHQDAATVAFVERARARGIATYCWYQDQKLQGARLRSVADAGLAGVVTDWPTEALTVLGRDRGVS